jgi:hypothetical protein
MKSFLIGVLALATSAACLPYSYETGGTLDEANGHVSVYVNIQPDIGWKWNPEYPATFRIKQDETLAPAKHSFEAGKIKMGVLLSKKIPSVVTVIASFSLCNKTVCRAFRNKQFNIRFGAP